MTGVPDGVRRFVAANIDSVGMLEALLFLRDHADRAWTAHELSRELRSSIEAATGQLAALRGRGLLAEEGGANPSYRYAPERPQLRRAVDELADCYATRRVRVISLIYSKPSDQVLTFGEAFRLRKRSDD